MGNSKNQKRYFWLKLKEDWFNGTTEKYLKSLPAGDSLLITYLKIQLMSLKTEGFLKYESLLPSAEEEIAMLIDEPVNNVRLLINVLIKTGAMERLDDNSLYLLSLQSLVGSEGSSTERVRRFRENQKALQCNGEQLQIETSNEPNVENVQMLQCNADVTLNENDEKMKVLQNLGLEEQRYNVTPMKQICNGEIEKELEIEKDIEIEKDKEKEIKKEEKETKQNLTKEKQIDLLKKNFRKYLNTVNAFSLGECVEYLDKLPLDVILEAFKITSKIYKPHWNYTRAVLDDWVKRKIDSLDKIELNNQLFTGKNLLCEQSINCRIERLEKTGVIDSQKNIDNYLKNSGMEEWDELYEN